MQIKTILKTVILKTVIIFYILFTSNGLASNNRENLQWNIVAKQGKCKYNTRQYILLTQGKNIKQNGCKIISGEWESFYLHDKLTSPKQIQIDHVLPWSWIYKHGANKLDHTMQIEVYNDLDNLRIASVNENQSKSNYISLPFHVNAKTNEEYIKIQCHVCNKWHLNDCNVLCD